MAHKKGVGSSRNGRDSNPQYRGIKKFGGERVVAGNIIVRQCGTKFHAGRNMGTGKDYTLFALVDGNVMFDREGRRVNIVPATDATHGPGGKGHGGQDRCHRPDGAGRADVRGHLTEHSPERAKSKHR